MKKILLLDIDYTLIKPIDNHDDFGQGAIPRPHLKEFLEKMSAKYDLVLYTAGDSMNIANFLRVLHHQLNMGDNKQLIRDLQLTAIHQGNCPMEEYPKPGGSSIEIKSLTKAAEELDVPIENLIILDDNPSYDHPHKDQIIQAEGFYENEDDNYLLRVKL